MTARDQRFLDLARHIAGWSKDPSTKVGAVVMRPDNTIASVGYNGFPRGIHDSPRRYEERETKLLYVVHAEANAILNAHDSLRGCTMYLTLPPCCTCAGLIIQAGITRVFYGMVRAPQRWQNQLERASDMLAEAHVSLDGNGIKWDKETF